MQDSTCLATRPRPLQEEVADSIIAPTTSADGRNSIRQLWPDRSFYLIEPLSLSVEFPPRLESVREKMIEVVAFADAIRNLEEVNQNAVDRKHVDSLRCRSADLLDDISTALGSFPDFYAVRRRADMLRGADRQRAAAQIMNVRETELVAFSGPLATWHAKSRALYHSAYFAVPCAEWNDVIDRADRDTADVQAYLQTRIHPELRLEPPPMFVVTRLLMCGGEANRYPKHFSYFLPEDEGVKHSPHKKTVVFINVYAELFRSVSTRLLQLHADCGVGAVAGTDDLLCQLLWFRGHDVGHGVRRDLTNYRTLREVGYWESMEIQELLADTFGFLFVTEGPWQRRFGVAQDRGVRVFLAEMLRYLHKGAHLYPDSGAAFMELCYLCDNGYVSLDVATARIRTDPERVVAGMRALAADLAVSYLATDISAAKAFIERYSIRRDNALTRAVRRFVSIDTLLPEFKEYRF